MSKQVINIGDTGIEVRDKMNDNFTETYSRSDKNTYFPAEGESFNTAVTNAADYDNIYVNGAMLLTANVTTTKNLIFQRGSTLGGAFTLTHKGYIVAGYYQIFETELINAGYNANKLVIVDWWGLDNTGVDDTYPQFFKAWKCMGSGFTMKVSSGTYRYIGQHHNPGLRDNCTFDFNNSVLVGEGGLYSGFGNYDTRYAFDANPFAEDFVKGSNYIVINDKSEWEALAYWQLPIKITLATTEVIYTGATSDYYDCLSIDIDRLETVGEEDRMYFKYPCPRDFPVADVTYPLRAYGDDSKVVRYFALTENIIFQNLKVKNMSFFISDVSGLQVLNAHFEADDDNFDYFSAALEIVQCDSIHISNYSAKNYRQNGYGYGISGTMFARLYINDVRITDCRHSIAMGGGYDTMSFLCRINNIELIANGKLYAGNHIDAHGNLIDYMVNNIRTNGLDQVYSSRSGIGIIRNVFAENCSKEGFYFSGSGAIDYTVCGVQNAIMVNSQDTIIDLRFDVALAIFENIHCDTDVTFLSNTAPVGTIIINNCTVNNVPVSSANITNTGTIEALYINNTLIE